MTIDYEAFKIALRTSHSLDAASALAFVEAYEAAKSAGQPDGYREAPFRRADHINAMTEVVRLCKRAMDKTVGPPWVALDKINRIAARQMLLMKTPMEEEVNG